MIRSKRVVCDLARNAADAPDHVTMLNVTEPLYTSLSLLGKMELHQREGLHNNAGPDLETCDRIPCYRNGCPNYTKLLSFLQEQERNPLIQECVPTLQEQVQDEAGPVGADVHDEGYDEASQICASKGQTL